MIRFLSLLIVLKFSFFAHSNCPDALNSEGAFLGSEAPSPILKEIHEALAEPKRKGGNKDRVQNAIRNKLVDATLSESEKLQVLDLLSLNGDRVANPYSLATAVISNPAALSTPALKKKMLDIIVFDTTYRRALGHDRRSALMDLIDRESFSTPFLTYARDLFEAQKPSRPMWKQFSKHISGYLLPKSAKKLLPPPDYLFKPLNSRNHKEIYKILGDPDTELSTRQQFRRALGFMAHASGESQTRKEQLWKNLIHGLQESHAGNFGYDLVSAKDGTKIFFSQGANRFLAITPDPEARVIFGGSKYTDDLQAAADTWKESAIYTLEIEPESL